MKKIVFVILLLTVACTKPNLNQILTAGSWSIKEACTTEYVPQEDCNIAIPAFDEAILATNHGTFDEQRVAVRKILFAVNMILSTDSKAKHYINYILIAL